MERSGFGQHSKASPVPDDARGHWGDDYAVLAANAIADSEEAEPLSVRLELLARAQAWAMLHVADVLSRLVEASGSRRAGQ